MREVGGPERALNARAGDTEPLEGGRLAAGLGDQRAMTTWPLAMGPIMTAALVERVMGE